MTETKEISNLTSKIQSIRKASNISEGESDSFKKLQIFMSNMKNRVESHEGVLRTGKYKGKTFEEVFEIDKTYLKWFSTKTEPKGLMLGDQKALISFLVKKELSKHEGDELEKYKFLSDIELIECLIPHEEEVKREEPKVGDIKFKFGKHKGLSIAEVYKKDPKYLGYILDNNKYDVEEYKSDPDNFVITKENWLTHKIILYINSVEL